MSVSGFTASGSRKVSGVMQPRVQRGGACDALQGQLRWQRGQRFRKASLLALDTIPSHPPPPPAVPTLDQQACCTRDMTTGWLHCMVTNQPLWNNPPPKKINRHTYLASMGNPLSPVTLHMRVFGVLPLARKKPPSEATQGACALCTKLVQDHTQSA